MNRASRGFRQAESIGSVRALLGTRSVYDELLRESLRQACELGVPVTVLAEVLGVHRATFYRQYPGLLEDGSQVEGCPGGSLPDEVGVGPGVSSVRTPEVAG